MVLMSRQNWLIGEPREVRETIKTKDTRWLHYRQVERGGAARVEKKKRALCDVRERESESEQYLSAFCSVCAIASTTLTAEPLTSWSERAACACEECEDRVSVGELGKVLCNRVVAVLLYAAVCCCAISDAGHISHHLEAGAAPRPSEVHVGVAVCIDR